MEQLKRCAFCGRRGVEAHKKYRDRCEDCGKLYVRYQSYKSQQKREYSAKRQAQLEKIITEYQDRKDAGYKVPHDIQ